MYPGGVLFRHYILYHSKITTCDAYVRNIDSKLRGEITPAQTSEIEHLLQAHAFGFYGFILKTLQEHFRQPNLQGFYISLFLDSAGCSVRGRELLSRLDVGLHRTKYLEMRRALVRAHDNIIGLLSFTHRRRYY